MTKEEYSASEINKLTSGLPRGSRQKIATITGKTYSTVNNVWDGKQFDKKIIAAISKLKSKTDHDGI